MVSLESVVTAHQKPTESEIRMHISNALKIAPFQEGGLKKQKPVEPNALEMEPLKPHANGVNYRDI